MAAVSSPTAPSLLRPARLLHDPATSLYKTSVSPAFKSPSLSLKRRETRVSKCRRNTAVRVAVGQSTDVEPVEAKKEPKIAGDDLPDDYTKGDPYKKLFPRRAGVLLHPTSLPGPHGIGDLGEGAFKFLDWLSGTGCTIWQVLPLVPPGRKSGEDGSPYAGQDANCGNTLLISLDELVKDGLLSPEDLPPKIPVTKVDYDTVGDVKDPLIAKAALNLLNSSGELKEELEAFINDPSISSWLPEAALFSALEHSLNTFWCDWPVPLRDRHPEALTKAREEHKEYIDTFIAQQFLFQRQWQNLHDYAKKLGISIIGDMPIYVGAQSADVWANRSQFDLDPETGLPTQVSGVPPDLFSATGQLWGSPLYNWNAMAENNYDWWVKRMIRAFDLYDEFRIDHFRGFAGYWAIPAGAETAIEGSWKLGPRQAFFDAIKAAVGKIDIIAEDLGVITSDVIALRNAINAPGMVVLQFAFGGGSGNPHLPHNHETNSVVYPGTHDNDTVVGFFSKASKEEKAKVLKYLQCEGEESQIHWEFIRFAASSVARTSIFAMQDIMGLDGNARMNTPAVQKGNWAWRVGDLNIFDDLKLESEKLKSLLKDYNRLH